MQNCPFTFLTLFIVVGRNPGPYLALAYEILDCVGLACQGKKYVGMCMCAYVHLYTSVSLPAYVVLQQLDISHLFYQCWVCEHFSFIKGLSLQYPCRHCAVCGSLGCLNGCTLAGSYSTASLWQIR